MLQPKKSKYRKHFRGVMRGNAGRGITLAFGEYGLKALTRGWVSARQIEAARKVITHATKRTGKLWIRIFPDKSYTKKGDIEGYVAVVRPGRIIFELAGVEKGLSQEALRKAAQKLSLRSKIITKI